MSREGWTFLFNSRSEHYFVDGRSLCRKWLGLDLDYGRTMNQPLCKACEKALAKREARRDKLVGEARQTKKYQMKKIKLRLERENVTLVNLLKQIRARLNKGFMRLDETQINDIVKMIDRKLTEDK